MVMVNGAITTHTELISTVVPTESTLSSVDACCVTQCCLTISNYRLTHCYQRTLKDRGAWGWGAVGLDEWPLGLRCDLQISH